MFWILVILLSAALMTIQMLTPSVFSVLFAFSMMVVIAGGVVAVILVVAIAAITIGLIVKRATR